MKLKLNDKKEIVAEVAEVAATATSVVAVDYSGLTASKMTKLRADARKVKVNLKIVRNNLARIAFTGTEYECLNNALTGPILLAFASEEPSSAARLMRDFAKENEQLQVRAISLDGKLFDKSQLEMVATLPTKEQALATLYALLQAPMSNLVRTLTAPQVGLVRTLDALSNMKQ